MHHQPLWFWLVLWLCSVAAYGQEAVTLTAAQLAHGQAVELDKLGWKYSPNDEPSFADPQFDDRAWETLNGTAITLDSIPHSGWRGIGWFRLRLKVDPALTNQPLALVMVHYGASEVYLDGKLLERFGTVGATPETEVAYNPNTVPLGIVLDGRSEHVIAVRHSCMAMRDANSWWSRWLHRLASRITLKNQTNRTNEYGAGFGIELQEWKQAQAKIDLLKSPGGRGLGLYASCFALAIGLLHLLLYWFYPSQRANLYFGLLACFAFVLFTSQYFLHAGHFGARGIMFLHIVNNLSLYLCLVFLLAFFYTAFLLRLPRLLWLWGVVAASFWFMTLFNLLQRENLIFLAIVLVESLRVVIRAIRKRVAGAWILGIGLLVCGIVLFIAAFYLSTGALAPLSLRLIGVFSLVLPPSIFLARRFARTNLDLAAQLAQVKQLSAAALEHEKVKAENDRRAAELEEARQLQLSMLPKKLPSLPHLDLAAYMKTATEVGGDYYDFHVGEDGTLTIAVGDATGHGLKAGTLVSSVKSLFVSLAYHPDIPHIFHRISAVLKEMKLRGLFMAMTMVKVKGHQMSVSIAGMPSVLIYRALSGEVEEVVMRALPLGGMTKYQYQQQELTLAVDDVVVLMSDGLPERFNPRDEMLDYERIFKALPAIAQQSAEEVIARLTALGDEWSEDRPQDDDVTFVVVKVK
jgi:serine phosphatase RsbU (regulator of sigma subunit)